MQTSYVTVPPACKKQSGGVLSGARCRLAYGPADATTATHCLLLQENPDWFDWFYLSGTSSPG